MGKENLTRNNGKSKGKERRQRVGLRQLKQRLMEGWLEDNQQEVWRPKEGAKVYVDWESFPESATTTWKSWTVQEWAVEGFYRQKTNGGWLLEFPSLEKGRRCFYELTDKWTRDFGSKLSTSRKIHNKDSVAAGRIGERSADEEGDLEYVDHSSGWERPKRDDIENLDQILEDGKGGRRNNSHLGIGTWNVNGLDAGDLQAAKWLMMERGLSLLCLQDTRLNKAGIEYLRLVWRQNCG